MRCIHVCNRVEIVGHETECTKMEFHFKIIVDFQHLFSEILNP